MSFRDCEEFCTLTATGNVQNVSYRRMNGFRKSKRNDFEKNPKGPKIEKNQDLLPGLVAQCSATPATVAATPPCSATPFQTQISVRHLPAHRGGGGATPKFLGGVARHRCYTCKTL